jgi:hypothetical protein
MRANRLPVLQSAHTHTHTHTHAHTHTHTHTHTHAHTQPPPPPPTTTTRHTFLVKLDDTDPDRATCQPMIESHPDRTLVFTEFTPNAPIPEGTFDVPAECKHPTLGHGINQ